MTSCCLFPVLDIKASVGGILPTRLHGLCNAAQSRYRSPFLM
jgi:hypothetical protein